MCANRLSRGVALSPNEAPPELTSSWAAIRTVSVRTCRRVGLLLSNLNVLGSLYPFRYRIFFFTDFPAAPFREGGPGFGVERHMADRWAG